ncbi:MAG: Xaa-Pro peptidase family protein [Actinomycetota bacterium]
MIHPGIATTEYEDRVRALQRGLSERGAGGAILTAEANYNYFAGYHHFAPWSTFCRPVFLLVPASGEPVLLVHAFPAADAKRDVWFSDVRSYDTLTYAPLPEVMQIVERLGMNAEPVGMELGAEHRIGLTPIELDDLREQLKTAGSPVIDVGELIWSLRVIKSEAEAALHKESGRIAAAAFDECFSRIRPGMTEADAVRIMGEAIAREGGRVGFFIATSGQGFYDRVAGLPRERELQPGDMLWIDLGVVYRGYWTDHCRAAVIGKPSQGQRDMWSAITALTRATVEQCRPGKTPVDIVTFIQEEGQRMGLDFSFAAGRSGHGIGLMSTEPPHIALYDHTELRKGMAFSIEPGWIDQDQGVFVSEENIVLSQEGYEPITVTPRELVQA